MKWIARGTVYADGSASEYWLTTEKGDTLAKAMMNQDGETYMVQRSKDGLVVASEVTETLLREWMSSRTLWLIDNAGSGRA